MLRPGQRTTCSPAGLERVQRLGRDAALAVEHVALRVHARQLDRLLQRQPEIERRDDDLHDRRADARRPRRAERRARRRPRRSTSDGAIMLVSRMPGRERERGDVEVGLAEHVVEVDAGAGNDDARAAAGRAGQRGGVPVGVEHADLGRPGGLRAAKWHSPRVPLGRCRPPRAPAAPPRRGRARARTRACAARSPSAARRDAGHRRGRRAGSRSGGPPASTASAWAISVPPEDGGGFVTNTRSR